MGGLASALALAKAGQKNITIYENAPNLGFVGAGIQLAPNMARILDRLGVWKDIEKDAVVLNETSIKRTCMKSENRTFVDTTHRGFNGQGIRACRLAVHQKDIWLRTYGRSQTFTCRFSLPGLQT